MFTDLAGSMKLLSTNTELKNYAHGTVAYGTNNQLSKIRNCLEQENKKLTRKQGMLVLGAFKIETVCQMSHLCSEY
jgi:hypothetical protein